jgi:hypothetical protein
LPSLLLVDDNEVGPEFGGKGYGFRLPSMKLLGKYPEQVGILCGRGSYLLRRYRDLNGIERGLIGMGSELMRYRSRYPNCGKLLREKVKAADGSQI